MLLKKVISVMIVLLCLLAPCLCQDITDMVEKVRQSVVMITVYDITGTSIGQGSGVFIDDKGLILTNAHVISGAYSADVVTSDDLYDEVSIYLVRKDCDLALIHINIDSSVVRPIDISESTVIKLGQRVIAIGNPLGLEGTVSDGIISSFRKTKKGIEYIQSTVPISPGSSGGVLVDEFGKLLGITTSTMTEGQNINFAVSYKTIGPVIKNSPDNPYDIKVLKTAATKVWYRVILKWVGNAIVFLISVFLSGAIVWIIVPIVIVITLGQYLWKGIVWLIQLPKKLLDPIKTGFKKDVAKGCESINTVKESAQQGNVESVYAQNKDEIAKRPQGMLSPGDVVVSSDDIHPPYKYFLVVKESYINQKNDAVFKAYSDGRYTFEMTDNVGYFYCDEFRVLSDKEVVQILRQYEVLVQDNEGMDSSSDKFEKLGYTKHMYSVNEPFGVIWFCKDYETKKHFVYVHVEILFGTFSHNVNDGTPTPKGLDFIGVYLSIGSKIRKHINKMVNVFRKSKSNDTMIYSIKIPIKTIGQLQTLDEDLTVKKNG